MTDEFSEKANAFFFFSKEVWESPGNSSVQYQGQLVIW